MKIIYRANSTENHPGGGGGGGPKKKGGGGVASRGKAFQYKSDGDARQKIQIKPLRETTVGEANA